MIKCRDILGCIKHAKETPDMLIRAAHIMDAEEVASVLRRSITELCVPDHLGDTQVLEQWLRNKTAENVRSWIEAIDRHILVAEENGNILGVGGASRTGEITLNYVAPEARFQGVSKAIVSALEAHLRNLGQAESRLTSTSTAHGFYLAMGYEDVVERDLSTTLSGHPMRKAL